MDDNYFSAWSHEEGPPREPTKERIMATPSVVHPRALYLHVADTEGQAAVHVPREELVKFVEAAQAFLEETKDPLPTLPHAVIRATVTTNQGQTQNVVLSNADAGSNNRWTSSPEGVGSAYWFADDDIASFEVLFPGVEA